MLVSSQRGSGGGDELKVLLKTGAFHLLEVMYARLSREDLEGESPISKAYSQESKQLIKDSIQAAHNAKKEAKRSVIDDGGLAEKRRQFHCAAFNALVAMLTCTSQQAKFYESLLFTDNSDRNEPLWENLIDCDLNYM